MVGVYLLLIKEYARAKTEAVTPEPQLKTILLSSVVFITSLKI